MEEHFRGLLNVDDGEGTADGGKDEEEDGDDLTTRQEREKAPRNMRNSVSDGHEERPIELQEDGGC